MSPRTPRRKRVRAHEVARPLSALVPVLAVTVLLGGCAAGTDAPPGSDGEAWPANVATEENGRLVEEVRVGGLDGELEYTFGSVTLLRGTAEGGLLVVDGQIPVLREYAPDGTHLRDIGQGGEGPGEYGTLYGVARLPDGRTVTYDPRAARITRFAPDGSVEGTARVDGMLNGYDGRFDPASGAFYASAISPSAMREGVVVEGGGGSVTDWARIELDGTVERLHPVPPPDPVGPRFVLSGAEMMSPYNTETLSVIGVHGDYWEVRNDSHVIRHMHTDGTESTITLEGGPIPLTDDEYAQWLTRGEAMWDRVSANPNMAGGPGRDEYVNIPRVKPIVRDLRTDGDGRLWVLRYTDPVFMPYSEEEKAEREAQNLPDHNWRDRHLWEVFDTDDRLIGRVELPQKVGLTDARGDMIFAWAQGPYREGYVIRYHVEWGSD